MVQDPDSKLWYQIGDSISYYKVVGNLKVKLGIITQINSNEIIVEQLQLDSKDHKISVSSPIYGLKFVVYNPHVHTVLKWKQVVGPIMVARFNLFEKLYHPCILSDVYAIEHQYSTIEAQNISISADSFLEGTDDKEFPLVQSTIGARVRYL
jgi:hypothetical protein